MSVRGGMPSRMAGIGMASRAGGMPSVTGGGMAGGAVRGGMAGGGVSMGETRGTAGKGGSRGETTLQPNQASLRPSHQDSAAGLVRGRMAGMPMRARGPLTQDFPPPGYPARPLGGAETSPFMRREMASNPQLALSPSRGAPGPGMKRPAAALYGGTPIEGPTKSARMQVMQG